MSRPLLIRLCPVVTSAELLDPELAREQMFSEGGLRFRPGDGPITVPLLLDHDHDRPPIGRIVELFTDQDPGGGRWFFARGEVDDDAVGWARKNAACSFGYSTLNRQEMPGGWTRVHNAVVSEVSILPPGVEPRHQRARVVWVGPARVAGCASGAEVITAGLIRRRAETDAEIVELERRLDFYGDAAPLELILEGMRHELDAVSGRGRLRLVG